MLDIPDFACYYHHTLKRN